MEEKLRRRKLEALKRGVHRVPIGETLPVSIHAVGIGGDGVAVIAELLRSLPPGGAKFHALAVDIGARQVSELQALADSLPPGRAEVTTVALDPPSARHLAPALAQYPDFLKLEYPFHLWGASYEPWLSAAADLSASDGRIRRAVAKAVYGAAYYAGPRPLERAAPRLRRHGRRGPGPDPGHRAHRVRPRRQRRQRHGHRPRTAPLDQDVRAARAGRRRRHRALRWRPGRMPRRPTVCRDERARLPERRGARTQGVVASCGELFRNPFTAGFILVPTQHVWAATHDLARDTHGRANQEVAALLTSKDGTGLWETLRLLNWVAAPFDAALRGTDAVGRQMGSRIGLCGHRLARSVQTRRRWGCCRAINPNSWRRASTEVADAANAAAAAINAAFDPDLPAQLVAWRAGRIRAVRAAVARQDRPWLLLRSA